VHAFHPKAFILFYDRVKAGILTFPISEAFPSGKRTVAMMFRNAAWAVWDLQLRG